MKNIVVLGSTGSIGCNTLDLVSRFSDRFRVVGLVAGNNVSLLEKQARVYRPNVISLTDEKAALLLEKRLKKFGVRVLFGPKGAVEVARASEADGVVCGIVGAAGLAPTLAAIQAGKTLALANKEPMVMAGEIMVAEAKKHRVKIIPVDSEHAGAFQLLQGKKPADVSRLILTASGGPFVDYSDQMKRTVTPKEATAHPTWKMGPKISVDSATLMNKGLEVIEAHWLFGLPPSQIDVLIHRQSIIHAMLTLSDGSVMAQMALPDMRIPISSALFYPDRAALPFPPLSLQKIGSLTFESPKKKSFPLLSSAYDALSTGGTAPAVLNAANEEAVSAFLSGRIGFMDIQSVVCKTLDAHRTQPLKTLDDALSADQLARIDACRRIQSVAARRK
jgi:1-deoxy-D-xylulose-5-phosphate reductoisomerase